MLDVHTLLFSILISTTGMIHLNNDKVLLRVNEQRNILHEIRKWKANWIGHILRRNCLLQRVIEGKVKVKLKVRFHVLRVANVTITI